MDMLNTVPDISLSGEKGPAACQSWSTLFSGASMPRTDIRLDKQGILTSWLGLQRYEDAAVRAMCLWIKSFEKPPTPSAPSVTIHGFKEIRECYVPLLRRALPHAKFIISFRRDTVAQSRSSWYARQRNSTAFVDQLLLSYRRDLQGVDTFELPLENFSVATFDRLLHWVGIDGCAYRYVLHDNENSGYLPDVASHARAIDCAPRQS